MAAMSRATGTSPDSVFPSSFIDEPDASMTPAYMIVPRPNFSPYPAKQTLTGLNRGPFGLHYSISGHVRCLSLIGVDVHELPGSRIKPLWKPNPRGGLLKEVDKQHPLGFDRRTLHTFKFGIERLDGFVKIFPEKGFLYHQEPFLECLFPEFFETDIGKSDLYYGKHRY